MAMEWTDELIARLRELWEQGLSTAEIGRQLSITKNAVVGKAHRLGLPSRPSPIRNKSTAEGAAKAARSRASRVKKTAEGEAVTPKEKAKKTPLEAKVSATSVVEEKTKAEKPKRVATKTADSAPQEEVEEVRVASAPRKVAPPRRVRESMDRSIRQGPTCQWPHGDPGTPEFHFCGAPPLPGKPYCAEHAAIAYVKIRDRRH